MTFEFNITPGTPQDEEAEEYKRLSRKFEKAVDSYCAGEMPETEKQCKEEFKDVQRTSERLAALWEKYQTKYQKVILKAKLTPQQRHSIASAHIMAMMIAVIKDGERLYGSFPKLMAAYVGALKFLALKQKKELDGE
jgi:hypothetical protein